MSKKEYSVKVEKFFDEAPEYILEILRKHFGSAEEPGISIEGTVNGWLTSGTYDDPPEGDCEFGDDVVVNISIKDRNVDLDPLSEDSDVILSYFEDEIFDWAVDRV